MLQVGDDFFFGDEVQIVVAFWVVAEFAFENAAAEGLQEQHLFVGGVEDAGEVGGGDVIKVGQGLAGDERKWGMGNEEWGMECGVRSAECGVPATQQSGDLCFWLCVNCE